MNAPEPDATFTVGVDATMSGDDGRGGMLAASMRYVSRLGSALSHALDLGDLIHIETTGSRTVIVQVSRDAAGDRRLRGSVIRSSRPTAPDVEVSGEVDDVVDECLHSLEACTSVRWAALVRRDQPLLHTDDILAAATLGQVRLRALGILSGIEQDLRETCVWLGYRRGTLVLVPVGAHCLMVSLDTEQLDAAGLLGSLLEAQSRLSPYDLTTATTLAERSAAADALDEYDEYDDPYGAFVPPSNDLPLTGARFAGAPGARSTSEGGGRWLRRPQVPLPSRR